MDVCPSCGDFVNELNPATGFCLSCSPLNCMRCGNERTTPGHKFCITCQRTNWLERNADALEKEMAEGQSFRQAIEIVSRENRATCIICGSAIVGRSKASTIFCTKTSACRRARGRYSKLIERKGFSKDLALEVVLRVVA